MSKVIKLKQSDIENIVSSLISEQEEEQNQLDPTKSTHEGLIIGKDPNTGIYYVVNGETGEILASK